MARARARSHMCWLYTRGSCLCVAIQYVFLHIQFIRVLFLSPSAQTRTIRFKCTRLINTILLSVCSRPKILVVYTFSSLLRRRRCYYLSTYWFNWSTFTRRSQFATVSAQKQICSMGQTRLNTPCPLRKQRARARVHSHSTCVRSNRHELARWPFQGRKTTECATMINMPTLTRRHNAKQCCAKALHTQRGRRGQKQRKCTRRIRHRNASYADTSI